MLFRSPIQGACFLKASNGRRGLAMRRLDHVYVGTSDEPYEGPLDAPRATRAAATAAAATLVADGVLRGLHLLARGDLRHGGEAALDRVWRGRGRGPAGKPAAGDRETASKAAGAKRRLPPSDKATPKKKGKKL